MTAGLIAKALRTRFWDARPFILSHLITARCNADCLTCLWKMPADSRADELTTAEIAALYQDAARAGFRALVLWGGEPLVRRDAGEALRAAAGAGLEATLITNGWFLEERADDVLPSTRRLLVSVDAIGERHDLIRRTPGLFARLDRGLVRARTTHPDVSVIVVCVLSRANLEVLEDVAAYGRERGAQVVFQAMNFSDYGFADRTLDVARLQLTAEEERDAARRIRALREDGYPVRDSNAYLSRIAGGAERYRCHYKKLLLRVEPNGDVLDCTDVARSMGNVRSMSLDAFTRGEPFRDFLRRAEGCNRCRDAGVIEASHLWEGRPGALWNALSTLGV